MAKVRYSEPFRLFNLTDARTSKTRTLTDEEEAKSAAEAIARETGAAVKDVLAPSKYFYSWLTVPGKRGTKRVSLRQETLTGARRERNKLNGEGRSGSTANATLGKAIEEWLQEKRSTCKAKTIRDYRSQMEGWTRFLKEGTLLASITRDDLLALLEDRKTIRRTTPDGKEVTRPTSPRTLNTNRELLRVFLRWARDAKGYVTDFAMQGVENEDEFPKDPRILAPAEVQRLLKACSTRYYVTEISGYRNVGSTEGGKVAESKGEWLQEFSPDPLLRFAVEAALLTALRRSNIENLRWEHVDLVDRKIVIGASEMKAKRAITIPVSPRLAAILGEIPKGGPHDRVFGSISLGKPLVAAARRAGLSKVTAHTMRRTAASWLDEHGVSGSVICDIGGWSRESGGSRDGAVFRVHYRGVRVEEMRRAVLLLDELVAPSATAKTKESSSGA